MELVAGLEMDYLKIPSGEVTNVPFLRAAARTSIPIILSTGLSTLEEVMSAVQVLNVAGTAPDQLTLMHCTTAYPTPLDDANLRAIETLRHSTGLRVGFSDHTLGNTASLLAIALGATMIEKHFTLDRSLPGPDHQASIEPPELADLINLISDAERALGTGEKLPTPSEEANRTIVRRSIVARSSIAAGEEFTEENVTTKRPEGGIPSAMWDQVIGRRARRAFNSDDLITLE
jgi:N,N'-diacetyllegionaminate synthase